MNLFSATRQTIFWSNKVLREFLRVRWWTTLGVLITSTLGRVFNLAAFFLPLKVILLVGSDGVPSYFRGFISPDDRNSWIIFLAAAAILSYVLYLLLERVSFALAGSASKEILRSASEMALFNLQEDIGRDTFARLCGVYSALFFAVIMMALGAWFSPIFFLVLAGVLMLEYFSTALLVMGEGPLQKGTARAYVTAKLGNYLQVLSSIAFLATFVYLVSAFIYGQLTNILVAILSILIARQALSALVAAVKNLADLKASDVRVNALMFRNERLSDRRSNELHTLFHYFRDADPRKAVETAAATAGVDMSVGSVQWNDPRIKGVYNFALEIGSAEEKPETTSTELQVFSPACRQLLENESLLFRHVSRDALAAPPLVARIEFPPFRAQIVGTAIEGPMSRSEWPEVFQTLHQQIVGFQPPEELVRTYVMSKPLLNERIDEELLSRMEVAVGGDYYRKLLNTIYDNLSAIQHRLGEIPLCIDNPDLTRGKVMKTRAGTGALIMNWGRWRLVPLGGGHLDNLKPDSAIRLLEQVRRVRDDIPSFLTVSDIHLAAQCTLLETHIKRKHFGKALKALVDILKLTRAVEQKSEAQH